MQQLNHGKLLPLKFRAKLECQVIIMPYEGTMPLVTHRQHLNPSSGYGRSVRKHPTPTEGIRVHSPAQRYAVVDVGNNGRLVDDDPEAKRLAGTNLKRPVQFGHMVYVPGAVTANFAEL